MGLGVVLFSRGSRHGLTVVLLACSLGVVLFSRGSRPCMYEMKYISSSRSSAVFEGI